MFVVETPKNDADNTFYPLTVLEVELVDQHTYRVIAPESFRRRWPTVNPRFFKIIADGPARALPWAEWSQL